MRLTSHTFMTGLVVGGMLGAAVATLYAPSEGPAIARRRRRQMKQAQDPLVDEQIDQSFPASDPPSWTPVTSTNPS